MQCYDRVLQIDESNVRTWFNKGLALGEIERNEEALVCFDRVLQIELYNTTVWFNKGITLRNLKRYDEALDSLSKALEHTNLIADENYKTRSINQITEYINQTEEESKKFSNQ